MLPVRAAAETYLMTMPNTAICVRKRGIGGVRGRHRKSSRFDDHIAMQMKNGPYSSRRCDVCSGARAQLVAMRFALGEAQ